MSLLVSLFAADNSESQNIHNQMNETPVIYSKDYDANETDITTEVKPSTSKVKN